MQELTGGDSLPLRAAPALQPPVPEVEPLPPDGPDVTVVALSVAAAALVLLAAVAAALWWRRHQRRRAAVCGDSDTSKPTAEVRSQCPPWPPCGADEWISGRRNSHRGHACVPMRTHTKAG